MPERTDPCVGCGQCCRGLKIVACAEDVLREPAVGTMSTRVDDGGKLQGADIEFWLAPQTRDGQNLDTCPFLVGDRCSIYPSRPRICVRFQPGCALCSKVRVRAGMGPLPGAAPPEKD